MSEFQAPKAKQLASQLIAAADIAVKANADGAAEIILASAQQLIAAATLIEHIQRQLSYTSAVHGMNKAADLALTSIIRSIGEGQPVAAPGSRPNGAGSKP